MGNDTEAPRGGPLRHCVAPRPAAWAFVAAAVAAAVADAVLAAFTSLIDVGGGGGGSWWIQAHLVERGRWLAFALLLVPAAAWLTPDDVTVAGDTAAAWRAVGAVVMAVPLLWIVATWLVQATLFTVAGRWDVDGRVFLAADYYRRLFIGYAPWLLAGVVTRMASRHT